MDKNPNYALVYEEAKATKPVYEGQLNQFTETLKAEMESVTLKMAPLKEPKSIKDKVLRDGDAPREIQDYLRSTIVTDDVNDLEKIRDAIHNHFKVTKPPKNNHANPTPTGLRNYNFKVEMPNGHVAEIQVMHSVIWDVKDASHEAYKKAQKIEELAANRFLTHEEEILRNQYLDEAFNIQNDPAVEAGLNKLLASDMPPETRAKYGFKPALDTPKLSATFNPASELPETNPAPHIQPGMMPDRVAGGVRAGASGFGLVAGGMYAHQAYLESDAAGMTLAGSNIVVSAADTGMDVAQIMGKSFTPALGTTMMRANVGLMAAESVYQVYREEGNFIDADGGLGHKGERAIAATATTGTALGTGMLLGGTGTATTATSGTLLATAGAAATPIILTGSAVYATVKFGDTMIDYSRLKDEMDRYAEQATAPLKFAQSEGDVPSLSDYKQSMFSAVKYSHLMNDGHMNGTIIRDEETGRITNFNGIDWMDERNLTEFEHMLDTQIARQQDILNENSSFLPDLFRDTGSIDREYFATTELMMLGSAKEELAMFRQEAADFHTDPALETKHGTLDLEGHPDYITVSISAERLRSGEEIHPVEERDMKLIMQDADTPPGVINMLNDRYGDTIADVIGSSELQPQQNQPQMAPAKQQPAYQAAIAM